MIISNFPGGSCSLSLDVVTASALPSAVVYGQIVVITDTAFNNVYVSTEEPASPAAGDILIALENGAEVMWGVSSDPYFLSCGLSYAAQYSGSAWTVVDAYYGVSGVWEEFSTTLPPVGTPLEDMEWADISKIAKAGKGEDYFYVGELKSVAVNGTFGSCTVSRTVYCRIIGINHNKNIEGNGIHYQFLNLWDKETAWTVDPIGQKGKAFMMNTTASNAGGWQFSYMRNTICTEFFNALPAELRDVIRECVKYTDNAGGAGGGDPSKVTATRDKIWLPTYTELTGKTPQTGNAAEPEYQEQYEYYAAGNSTIRMAWLYEDLYCNWWLRGPQVTSTTKFNAANTSGTITSLEANYNYGFAPCFMV